MASRKPALPISTLSRRIAPLHSELSFFGMLDSQRVFPFSSASSFPVFHAEVIATIATFAIMCRINRTYIRCPHSMCAQISLEHQDVRFCPGINSEEEADRCGRCSRREVTLIVEHEGCMQEHEWLGDTGVEHRP